MDEQEAGRAADRDADRGATTDHDVIRRWADDRHATPVIIEGPSGDDRVGELTLDFDFGNALEDLRQLTWDEWLAAFDERGLRFRFSDAPRADGSVSYEYHLEPRRAG